MFVAGEGDRDVVEEIRGLSFFDWNVEVMLIPAFDVHRVNGVDHQYFVLLIDAFMGFRMAHCYVPGGTGENLQCKAFNISFFSQMSTEFAGQADPILYGAKITQLVAEQGSYIRSRVVVVFRNFHSYLIELSVDSETYMTTVQILRVFERYGDYVYTNMIKATPFQFAVIATNNFTETPRGKLILYDIRPDIPFNGSNNTKTYYRQASYAHPVEFKAGTREPAQFELALLEDHKTTKLFIVNMLSIRKISEYEVFNHTGIWVKDDNFTTAQFTLVALNEFGNATMTILIQVGGGNALLYVLLGVAVLLILGIMAGIYYKTRKQGDSKKEGPLLVNP